MEKVVDEWTDVEVYRVRDIVDVVTVVRPAVIPDTCFRTRRMSLVVKQTLRIY